MEIDDKEFEKIADNVIDIFYAGKMYDKDLMLKLRSFMMSNPEHHSVVSLRNWVNELISKNLFNYNFIKNLNYNSKYFDRLLELYINRPFSDEKFYANGYSFISKLSQFEGYDVCGSYESQVIQCMNYFKSIGVERLTEDYEKKVLRFLNDNATLLKYGNKDIYPESYLDALSDYITFSNKKDYNRYRYQKFLNFKNNNYPGSTDLYVLEKLNKILLGYLGEYYFYNKYIINNNVRFVSKDIGNGAGYDMYINNGDIFEDLYEVKTTATFEYGSDEDKIFITPNEYECMERVSKSNLPAKYFISRLYYHDKQFEELLLKYIGGDTLIGNNCEYNIVEDGKKMVAKRRK